MKWRVPFRHLYSMIVVKSFYLWGNDNYHFENVFVISYFPFHCGIKRIFFLKNLMLIWTMTRAEGRE